MTKIVAHITFCCFLLLACSCLWADSSPKCFDHFVGNSLPFEIYNKDDWSTKYIESLEEGRESPDDEPFIKPADQVSVAPLCNGNFIATWTYQHHRFPVPLTGRIFDSKFSAVHNDFPISEKHGLEEWEHSVSTLYDDGFVVTWKTWKTLARKEIQLRGRIFDNSGKPKGRSFDIYRQGTNNGGYVYGLPNGGFVVVWSNSKSGLISDLYNGAALLRVFDKKGIPRSKEIIVESHPQDESCLLKPRGYITRNGDINVFMICQSAGFDQSHFFHSARSFNDVGKPLTGVLRGKDMLQLQGFSYLKEQYLYERLGLKTETKVP